MRKFLKQSHYDSGAQRAGSTLATVRHMDAALPDVQEFCDQMPPRPTLSFVNNPDLSPEDMRELSDFVLPTATEDVSGADQVSTQALLKLNDGLFSSSRNTDSSEIRASSCFNYGS